MFPSTFNDNNFIRVETYQGAQFSFWKVEIHNTVKLKWKKTKEKKNLFSFFLIVSYLSFCSNDSLWPELVRYDNLW